MKIKTLLLVLLGSCQLNAKDLRLEYEAKTYGLLGIARFSFWAPELVKKPSAVLVLLTGLQGDGRTMVDQNIWREFAKKRGLVLIGCHLTTGSNRPPYYEVRNTDQGQSLFDALSAFTTMSGLDSVKDRPLLLWGISAGGQYTYNFACLHPQKVRAFAVNKGGFYDDNFNQGVLKVPGIFFYGAKDVEFRIGPSHPDLLSAGKGERPGAWLLSGMSAMRPAFPTNFPSIFLTPCSQGTPSRRHFPWLDPRPNQRLCGMEI